MAKVPYKKYVANVNSVYEHKPKYVLGRDTFTECDCIGMCKRALKMAGDSAAGLSGTNYAARYTILNLKKLQHFTRSLVQRALLLSAALRVPIILLLTRAVRLPALLSIRL